MTEREEGSKQRKGPGRRPGTGKRERGARGKGEEEGRK